jgi:predicted glycoside hydrolase/deacetylase ChbG (UPF0249 family)
MQGQLIVNADDYGLSRGVNRGIIRAMKEGVVTSTTVMVNMPDMESHLDELLALRGVSVGVHLVLSAGKPMLAPETIPSLVNETGFFTRPYSRAVIRANPSEAKEEWRAQIEHLIKRGIELTHLDSHHHVHIYPELLDVAIALAHEYSIPAIRSVSPQDVAYGQPQLTDVITEHTASRAQARIAASGLSCPDRLLTLEGDLAHKLSQCTQTQGMVVELCCHPGFVDDTLRALSSMREEREAELALLVGSNIRDLIAMQGLQLVSYGVLAKR